MTGEARCDLCGQETLYGRHLGRTLRCPALCSDDELDQLHKLLDRLGIKPKDLVKHLDLSRQGKRIRVRFLSEMTSEECRARIAECEASLASRNGSKGGA